MVPDASWAQAFEQGGAGLVACVALWIMWKTQDGFERNMVAIRDELRAMREDQNNRQDTFQARVIELLSDALDRSDPGASAGFHIPEDRRP